MRISWKWLSELVDLSSFKTPQALADCLIHRGIEVESIEDQGQVWKHVVTAQIQEVRPHPQADRLKLCQVDCGTGLSIVCGAPNVSVHSKVVLAREGALLPHGMKITRSKIRGEVSEGMLCSESELGLKEASEGIWILPADTPVGQSFAEFLKKDDVILVLKVTPNRGDCLSHYGLAREIESALAFQLIPSGLKSRGIPLKQPRRAMQMPEASQFSWISLEGVTVGPSPVEMVQRLEALGCRSVNNVVDATQWILLELGYPTHAYDLDQIEGDIHVRKAFPGEKVTLLNDQEVTLQGEELVVADAKQILSLAGVMGGRSSQVTSTSRRILLECAEFDSRSVRRSAQQHRCKTDASYHFERGVDPQGLEITLTRLVQLVIQVAGGKILEGATWGEPRALPVISFTEMWMRDFLGLSVETLPLIFQSLHCEARCDAQTWEVRPPSYRLDLNCREDLAEEVARTIGYAAIPRTIPVLTSAPGIVSMTQKWLAPLQRIKESLVKSGLAETIHYPFTSAVWLKDCGVESSLVLQNPLSEEFAVLVPSLLPSLIRTVRTHWDQHFGSESLAVRLFECRSVFEKTTSDTGIAEPWRLAFVLTGPRFLGGLDRDLGEVDFYDLKAIVDHLVADLGLKGVRYQPFREAPLFHPTESLTLAVGPTTVGHLGRLHPRQAQAWKVKTPLWLAELDLMPLMTGLQNGKFTPWYGLPWIERDFAFTTEQWGTEKVNTEKICQLGLKLGKPFAQSVKVFDIYQGQPLREGMTSVAVRVIFYDVMKTLQEVEIDTTVQRMIEGWKKEFHLELRE